MNRLNHSPTRSDRTSAQLRPRNARPRNARPKIKVKASMPNSPEMRHELKARVQRLCDEKLLLGNPERLRNLATEALDMSRHVGPPWEQLAAYRVAHVLLREPSLAQNHAEETARLKQIAEHLELAANYERERLFGPLPHIYLIAVWNRLMQHDQDHAADYRQKLVSHFETAVRLTNQLDLHVPSSNESETRQLQRHSFNLLELASYCLDLDYSVLRGRGGLSHDNLFLNGSWQIVSNDPEMQAVKYDYEFGLAELNEIVAKTPDSVGFVFSNLSATRNGWKHHAAQEMSHEINDDFLKLLSVIFDEPRLTERRYTNERNRYFPDHSPDDLRQLKKRGKDAIVRLTGVQAGRIFPNSSFELKIPVYGLINRAASRP